MIDLTWIPFIYWTNDFLKEHAFKIIIHHHLQKVEVQHLFLIFAQVGLPKAQELQCLLALQALLQSKYVEEGCAIRTQAEIQVLSPRLIQKHYTNAHRVVTVVQ